MALGKHYVTFWKRGAELPPRKEIETNIRSIISLIKSYNPDIIMLQEVSEYACVSRYVDLLQTLKSELTEYRHHRQAYYWNTHYIPIVCYGSISGPMDYSLVIFSKHEIVSSQIHELYNAPESWLYRTMSPYRIMLQAEIQVDQKTLTVVATHFDAHDINGQTRRRQQQNLKTHLQQLNCWNFPWVMGGDLNLVPPGSPTQTAGTPRFTLDIYDEEGIYIFPEKTGLPQSGRTWPCATAHETPPGQDIELNLILDYLMVSSKHLNVTLKQVIQKPLHSDHCPVIMDCEFRAW